MCNNLITMALKNKYSDIHFTPKTTHYALYFRSNGTLSFLQKLSLEISERCITFLKYNSGLDIGEQQLPQSGRYEWPELTGVSIRISVIPNYRSLPSLVLRCVSPVHQLPLALFQYQEAKLKDLIAQKSGLLLFSGAVGSGKTATIYSLLEYISQKPYKNILTIEDPVEIPSPFLTQFQINQTAGFSFDVALRATLRHDPDILMIGEIRDSETAKMALRMALTGHLVVATIHSSHSLGVLYRLKNLGLPPTDLKQALLAIISQKFVPIQHHLVQRALIYEILTKPGLTSEILSDRLTFNALYQKGVLYGFIPKTTDKKIPSAFSPTAE
ncbi:ATPase, T2SS/T4P/T4SS family [Brochothrix thermosphacta]|uniref:ATPase, T2SS/T4P/T4SS family n=1 Tax=Brochothrix thermosphacta TaxID=2756 RepID=UPI003F73EEEC